MQKKIRIGVEKHNFSAHIKDLVYQSTITFSQSRTCTSDHNNFIFDINFSLKKLPIHPGKCRDEEKWDDKYYYGCHFVSCYIITKITYEFSC